MTIKNLNRKNNLKDEIKKKRTAVIEKPKLMDYFTFAWKFKLGFKNSPLIYM